MHDANGNLTQISSKNSTKVTRLFWDVDNQLRTIEEFDNLSAPATKTVEYFYDSQGKRVGKRIDGVNVENYIYSGDNVYIAEGTKGERLYIHSDQIDDPLMLRKDGRYFSIHTDHLGSVQPYFFKLNIAEVRYLKMLHAIFFAIFFYLNKSFCLSPVRVSVIGLRSGKP